MSARTLVPLRILVVEDSADTAQTMQLLLRLWGRDCLVAGAGPAALEVAAAFGPDVVFLDIGLPGLNGYEVARRLRHHPATAAALLVAVTGYGQPRDVQLCWEAGFDCHLLKPVEPQALRGLLEQPRLFSAKWAPGTMPGEAESWKASVPPDRDTSTKQQNRQAGDDCA
jgi:two-component system CheB/CheR fusion protein